MDSRFQSPPIDPDVRISRIRLSVETSVTTVDGKQQDAVGWDDQGRGCGEAAADR
jgi:hypothetical protein